MSSRKQKNVGEARDVIDAIGHENEKEGIKWAKHFVDEFNREEAERNKRNEDVLRKFSQKRSGYNRAVLDILDTQVKQLERPGPGFWVETGLSSKGVWVKLHDVYKRIWARGFKPCGIPHIDLNAINLLCGFTEDKMYEVSDTQTPTDSGIYLP